MCRSLLLVKVKRNKSKCLSLKSTVCAGSQVQNSDQQVVHVDVRVPREIMWRPGDSLSVRPVSSRD